jgi:rhodanese-related sulfurtransferase
MIGSILQSLKKASRFLLLIAVFGFGDMMQLYAQETKPELPAQKQTTLGWYVTSAQAYAKWQASHGKVKIIDVRTLDEYIFIGHAPMAYNVPLAIQTHEWNPETNQFVMKLRDDFVAQVKKVAQPSDTIMVTCRSGGRSAMAVNQLAAAGYKYVYNIIDGFEGDKVKDENSVYYQKRMVNGWKNCGAPWTYDLNPDLIVLPEE